MHINHSLTKIQTYIRSEEGSPSSDLQWVGQNFDNALKFLKYKF